MKGQIFVWVLLIFVLVLLGLGYAQMIQMDQVTSQKIAAVEGRVSDFDKAIKSLETDVKNSTTAVKGFESRIASGETQSRNIDTKIEALMKDVADMKGQFSTLSQPATVPVAPEVPSVTASAGSVTVSASSSQADVELGTIPVQK